MALLPDWNSVESTAYASSVLFWVGIGSLILLAGAEVASHIYANRSAELQSERLHDEKRGRLLKPNQLSELGAVLGSVDKPTAPLHLMAQQGDGEAIHLAHQLLALLSSAGFPATSVEETFLLGGCPPGVIVRHGPEGGATAAGLVAGLRRAGVETLAFLKPDLSVGQVEIFVSRRRFPTD